MTEGIIVKGIAGFYYVKANDKIYECKARGKFRRENTCPLIGDHVKISIQNEMPEAGQEYPQGTIEEILPRKNKLIRPAVANVDQGIIVFAVSYPQMHLDLLDRFLIMVEAEGIKPYIVLNKIDESEEQTYREVVEGYTQSGYEVLCVSAKKNRHIDNLKCLLKDKISFFAGPSGVGKSTLLNAVDPGLKLQTGEVSIKIKRGKHTTRHVELLTLNEGGFVLDTPGFTSLQFENLEASDLRYYFPEFRQYEGKCKYKGCMHIHEPGCAVKEALQEDKLYRSRYDNYVTYYTQLKEIRRW